MANSLTPYLVPTTPAGASVDGDASVGATPAGAKLSRRRGDHAAESQLISVQQLLSGVCSGQSQCALSAVFPHLCYALGFFLVLYVPAFGL
jgi:hypothetical protein